MKRWKVRYRNGEWLIYDGRPSRFGDVCHDSCDTLPEAHTLATQYAVADVLYAPGGLTRLKAMQEMASQYLGELVRRHLNDVEDEL